VIDTSYGLRRQSWNRSTIETDPAELVALETPAASCLKTKTSRLKPAASMNWRWLLHQLKLVADEESAEAD
jgi:hypothetical protein